jgi:hypothetical protein
MGADSAMKTKKISFRIDEYLLKDIDKFARKMEKNLPIKAKITRDSVLEYIIRNHNKKKKSYIA